MAFSLDKFAGGLAKGYTRGQNIAAEQDKARTRNENREYQAYGKDAYAQSAIPSRSTPAVATGAPEETDPVTGEPIAPASASAPEDSNTPAPDEMDPDQTSQVAKEAGAAVKAMEKGEEPPPRTALGAATDDTPPTQYDWDKYRQLMIAKAHSMGRPELAQNIDKIITGQQQRGTLRHLDRAIKAIEVGDMDTAQKAVQKSYGFLPDGKSVMTFNKGGKVMSVVYDEKTGKEYGKPKELTSKSLQEMRLQAADPTKFMMYKSQMAVANAKANESARKDRQAQENKMQVANDKWVGTQLEEHPAWRDAELAAQNDKNIVMPTRAKVSQLMLEIQRLNKTGVTSSTAGDVAIRMLTGKITPPADADIAPDGSYKVDIGGQTIRMPGGRRRAQPGTPPPGEPKTEEPGLVKRLSKHLGDGKPRSALASAGSAGSDAVMGP